MSSTIDIPPAQTGPDSQRRRGSLWRSRWAAIGAAVAVTLGGGTLHLVGANDSEPSSIISVTPTRILDTRDPVDLGLSGPFVSAVSQNLRVTGSVHTPTGPQIVVPDGATGVLLNITVVQPTAAGFISVRPSGTPGPPETSSLNFETGDITPNAVFVALPTSGPNAGQIEITYDAFGTAGPTADVLGDVVAYTMESPAVYTKAQADEAFLPSFAVVSSTGVLVRGRNAVTSMKFQVQWAGIYAVYFDRDIADCSYQVSVVAPEKTNSPPTGFANASLTNDATNSQLRIETRDGTGSGADLPFHVTVYC